MSSTSSQELVQNHRINYKILNAIGLKVDADISDMKMELIKWTQYQLRNVKLKYQNLMNHYQIMN